MHSYKPRLLGLLVSRETYSHKIFVHPHPPHNFAQVDVGLRRVRGGHGEQREYFELLGCQGGGSDGLVRLYHFKAATLFLLDATNVVCNTPLDGQDVS